MYTKWTAHLKTEDEKADFKSHIVSAKPVLERVLDLLKEEENGIERSELDLRTYDTPNWAYKQSYKNGYRSALGFVSKLIDLDKQEI